MRSSFAGIDFCYDFSFSPSHKSFRLVSESKPFVSFGWRRGVDVDNITSFENVVVLSPTRVTMHLNEVENLDQTVEAAIMRYIGGD